MLKFSPPTQNLIKREILAQAQKELAAPEIMLFLGMRQVGKTSLLYLLLDYLLKKVSPHQLFYFDLENINLLEFLNSFSDFDLFWHYLQNEGADPQKKIFVFIDEIQHLRHPSQFLKYLYDHYQIKFVVSGSSSLEIKKKFTDRLTGRQTTFVLSPLSFREYLLFQKQKKLLPLLDSSSPSPEQKTLSVLFEEYARWGGFPRVALTSSLTEKEKILANIFDLYLRRDIKDIGGLDDVHGYNQLVKLLAYQIGNLVNEQELSLAAGLSRVTLRKYLFLLENTFVLDRVIPFFTNKRKELTKMPKVYFKDTGLRNFITQEIDSQKREISGVVVENVVYNQLCSIWPNFEIKFWRTKQKQEVDFVLEKGKKIIPLEVKYQSFPSPQIPRGLKNFIKTYSPPLALVITKKDFFQEKLAQTEVWFLPAWQLWLTKKEKSFKL